MTRRSSLQRGILAALNAPPSCLSRTAMGSISRHEQLLRVFHLIDILFSAVD